MYEPNKADSGSAQSPSEPGEVIAWLKDRDAVEQAWEVSLGTLPSERDATLARMADVLQAAAQGLGIPAAAVWAGVSEPVLRRWIETDPSFAAALYGASALAAAHGAKPERQHTPAMVRVVLIAMSNGTTMLDALKLAGFREYRFRALLKASPTLEALLEAARRVRPNRGREKGAYVPGSYRPRHPGRKSHARSKFRLVQRGAPEDRPD
ncbi:MULTISPECIES: hypothetical protein [unclassified Streptomyces]|uniref:hypothetical protein n=1 Tax=unclassified Streptomyces TaxID=2593676 RepID=UPI0035DB1F9D